MLELGKNFLLGVGCPLSSGNISLGLFSIETKIESEDLKAEMYKIWHLGFILFEIRLAKKLDV